MLPHCIMAYPCLLGLVMCDNMCINIHILVFSLWYLYCWCLWQQDIINKWLSNPFLGRYIISLFEYYRPSSHCRASIFGEEFKFQYVRGDISILILPHKTKTDYKLLFQNKSITKQRPSKANKLHSRTKIKSKPRHEQNKEILKTRQLTDIRYNYEK